MKTAAACCLSVVLLLSAPSLVSAQDAPKLGLTTGYPASIGLLWHATEAIALRPEMSFSHASSESEYTPVLPALCPSCALADLAVVRETEASSSAWQLNIGAVFYLSSPGQMRVYVTPRFEYWRVSTSSDTEPELSIDIDSDNSTSRYGLSGSFGVQFALHPKVSIFGEAGLGTQWADYSTGSTFSETKISGRSYSTRTGIGVIIYF